jgi:hypothetical protein
VQEPKRIDLVLVAAQGRRFEISWNDREELLARARQLAKSTAVITAFRNVGTSGVVELDRRGCEIVLAALEEWEREADGLPAAAAALRDVCARENAVPLLRSARDRGGNRRRPLVRRAVRESKVRLVRPARRPARGGGEWAASAVCCPH